MSASHCILLNVTLCFGAGLSCKRISAPHSFYSLHCQAPALGAEVMFSMANKMETGTGLSPCSTLLFYRNNCFILLTCSQSMAQMDAELGDRHLKLYIDLRCEPLNLPCTKGRFQLCSITEPCFPACSVKGDAVSSRSLPSPLQLW